jgi:hypothetical protein
LASGGSENPPGKTEGDIDESLVVCASVAGTSFGIMPSDAFNVQVLLSERRCVGEPDLRRGVVARNMCVAFLLYYPRKVVQIAEGRSLGWICSVGYGEKGFLPCDAPVSSETLSDGTVPYQRTFGAAPVDQCSSESAASNEGSTGGPGGGSSSAGIAASRAPLAAVHNVAGLAAGITFAVALHLL